MRRLSSNATSWLWVISSAAALGAGPVLAQSGTGTPNGELPFRSGGYFELLLRTVLYLVAISLLIYVGLRWVYPRIFRWNFPAGKKLTVLDRLPMGGTRSICVLRVGERYYLVGVTDGQIALLTELDAAEMEAHYGPARAVPGAASTGSAAHSGVGADPGSGPPWKRFLAGSRDERNLKG